MNGTPGQQLRINETENGISEDWRNVFLRNANSIVLWNGKGTQEDQTDDAASSSASWTRMATSSEGRRA